MEAQDALRAVSISSIDSRTSTQGTDSGASSKRSDVPQSVEASSSADAVLVQLSAQATANDRAKERPDSEAQVESAPVEHTNTVVRFDITEAERKEGLQFKIVDRVSGDVVREFPPDYTPDQPTTLSAARHVKLEA